MKTKALLSVLSFLLLFTTVRSQNVVPDSSFGNKGILNIVVYEDDINYLRPVAQSTGKILVPYSAGDDFGYQTQGYVSRSTADGVLDSTFGTGGYRYVDDKHFPVYIIATAVQPDDKILVLYRHYSRSGTFDSLNLERWLPNGKLDSSFNAIGLIGAGGNPGQLRGNFLATKPDGHIVLCFSKRNQVYITQFNKNGSVDRSFGTNGIIYADSSYNHRPTGLTALPDNRIVIANEYMQSGSYYNNLYAYTATGQPDVTFGTNGAVKIGEQISNPGNIVDLKGWQGKLYVYAEGSGRDVLLRYNGNGTPDATFGTRGKVYSGSKTNEYVSHQLDIQPDGKVIILTTGKLTYKRYNTNGTLDTAFATNGIFTPPSRSAGLAFRLINGRIFISSLFYDKDFEADMRLSAFKFQTAAPLADRTTPMALKGAQVQAAMGVYPNPVHDVLTVTGLAGNAPYRLLLTSQDGKTVAIASTHNASYQLNTGALVKGIYYLRIVDGSSRSSVFTINKQ